MNEKNNNVTEEQLEEYIVTLKEINEMEIDEPSNDDLKNFDRLPTDIKCDDSVKMFLKEIGQFKLLSTEDEIRLSNVVTEGLHAQKEYSIDPTKTELLDKINKGIEARNRMVEGNYRLIVSIAKKYINRGLPLMDLIDEGVFGAMHASEKFEPDKGFKFSTYATWWIKQSIARAIADQSRIIRLPVHINEQITKLVKAQRSLLQELNREPTDEELASYLDIEVSKVIYLKGLTGTTQSLDEVVGEDDDSTLQSLVQDKENLNPYQYTALCLVNEAIKKAIGKLSDREEIVLKYHFGFECDFKTLDEIGEMLGVTRERVRQIQIAAIKKLSLTIDAEGLLDLINPSYK